MSDTEQTETFRQTVARVATRLPAALTAILSFAGVAYVLGWRQEKAYFTEFGAEWLVDDISSTRILQSSYLPLSALAVFVFFVLRNAILREEAAGDPKRWMRVDLAILYLAAISFSWVSIANNLLVLLKRESWLLLFFEGVLLAALAAVALRFVIHLIREKRESSTLWLFWYGLILVGLIYLPEKIGRAIAVIDMNPEDSKLPVVELVNSQKEQLRLLTLGQRVVYVVVLGPRVTGFPKIRPVKPENILWIHRHGDATPAPRPPAKRTVSPAQPPPHQTPTHRP